MPLGPTDSQGPSFRLRIDDTRLLELYDYWLIHRGDRPAMLRADLDPVSIPQLLKSLILTDVSGDGPDIRYRLVGTEIVAAHGLEYTGMTVEELTSGATLEYTRQLYGIVVSNAVPVYSEGPFQWADKEFRWTRRLHLPMSRDGSAVDMVLAGQIFENGRPGRVERMVPGRADELTADLERARAS
jgi:hypothetical protein